MESSSFLAVAIQHEKPNGSTGEGELKVRLGSAWRNVEYKPDSQSFDPSQLETRTDKEIRRCIKRYMARRIYRTRNASSETMNAA